MIQDERIKFLNTISINKEGNYVVYWMQQSQRIQYNHAFEYAKICANELQLPIIVFFGLTDSYPQGQIRHYYFMMQGLAEIQKELNKESIHFVIQKTSPDIGVINVSRKAALIVVDAGYLRIQREWRQSVALAVTCPVIQVESDVIVPVETASPQEEYSAATLRSKITKVLPQYLVPLKKTRLKNNILDTNLPTMDLTDIDSIISSLKIKNDTQQVQWIYGGTTKANEQLKHFIKEKLKFYDTLRNDPSRDYLSNMSPYLHFGHISPLYIAQKVMATDHSAKNAFLEQLVVRRELSMNFVYHNTSYDSFDSLPQWCKTTLLEHRKDSRQYIYSLEQLKNAETHDPFWNAAQTEMAVTGKMHGYMRMYWGKKIIEWTKDPKEAFQRALYLNNTYSIDGRDPNGFTGIAWCFGKHDRPWKKRPIFGSVRYMNAAGLVRKFDMDAYVKKVNSYLK